MTSLFDSPAPPPPLLRSGGVLPEGVGPSGPNQASVGLGGIGAMFNGSQVLSTPVAGPRSGSRSNGALPGLPPGQSEPLFQNVGRDLGRPLGLSRRISVDSPPPQFSDGLSDFLGLERQSSSSRSPAPGLPASAAGSPDTPAPKNTQLAESPVADKPFERMDGKLDNAAVLNPGPPTMKLIDEFDMYRKLEFDPDGLSEAQVALTILPLVRDVFRIVDETVESTGKKFRNRTIWDTNADAFRHALWNFELTKRFGAHHAKRITDAHEISNVNDLGDRIMDFFNNNIGRRLAMDPRNHNRDGATVILEAIKRGELQTEPFRVQPVPSRLQQRRPSRTRHSG
jgi:Domain of unknown function (DUF6973)